MLAVLLWQVLSVSLLVTVLSSAAVLVLPEAEPGEGLAAFLRTCAHTLRERYATVGGAAAATTGIVLLAVVTGRLAWCLSAELRAGRRGRSVQLERLRLAAGHDRALGAYVVDDERVVVFCVPGRQRAIVLTSAAVQALSRAELDAVLAHESAHLRWRHDVVLATARVLVRAFPFVPTFRLAHQHLGELVEMAADDSAARRHGAHAVGSAARPRRMLSPGTALGYRVRGAVVALAVNVLAVPLLVTVAPTLATAAGQHCPFVV